MKFAAIPGFTPFECNDLPPLPDWQAEWRKQSVLDEREACARLAEEQGQTDLADAIRRRGEPIQAQPSGRPHVEPLVDTGFGQALFDFEQKLLRANPPPPSAPPDGGKWMPKITLEDGDGPALFARLTWEVRK